MVYCYSELITLSQWITSHSLAIQVIRSPLGFHSNKAALKLKKNTTQAKKLPNQQTNQLNKQNQPQSNQKNQIHHCQVKFFLRWRAV